jgi:predicted nucleic acid-binding protein
MPETVVNTSVFQYLFQLGLLEVLPKMYGSVVVPDAVRAELAQG